MAGCDSCSKSDTMRSLVTSVWWTKSVSGRCPATREEEKRREEKEDESFSERRSCTDVAAFARVAFESCHSRASLFRVVSISRLATNQRSTSACARPSKPPSRHKCPSQGARIHGIKSFLSSGVRDNAIFFFVHCLSTGVYDQRSSVDVHFSST